jgi:uncharacterized lipoprotein
MSPGQPVVINTNASRVLWPIVIDIIKELGFQIKEEQERP